MSEYDASTYGERIAEVYDHWYAGQDTEGALEFLFGLARGATLSNWELAQEELHFRSAPAG
jgi:hypothetical protein